MGYYADLEDARFHISKTHHNDVIKALYNFSNEFGPAWVNKDDVLRAYQLGSIVYMFYAFGWDVLSSSSGDIVGIEFCNEKMGDEDYMFRAIEKFVSNRSYIQMCGEDGSKWRWYFLEGKMYEEDMRFHWESDEILGL